MQTLYGSCVWLSLSFTLMYPKAGLIKVVFRVEATLEYKYIERPLGPPKKQSTLFITYSLLWT